MPGATWCQSGGRPAGRTARGEVAVGEAFLGYWDAAPGARTRSLPPARAV